MKKLISIGVALALLTMAVVPVAVAAEEPTPPDSYSKIPFGILGTGIELVGTVIAAIPMIADALAEMGLTDITAVTGPVGGWTMNEFAWLTELTGWTMVAIGDVMASAQSLLTAFGVLEADLPIKDVAKMFYVLGNRIFDAWDTIPTGNMTDQLPPALGLLP